MNFWGIATETDIQTSRITAQLPYSIAHHALQTIWQTTIARPVIVVCFSIDREIDSILIGDGVLRLLRWGLLILASTTHKQNGKEKKK